MQNSDHIALALSGGGIRGIGHIGVLKALEELGIKISAISGTSAGAIVGAFHAAGFKAEEILQIAKTRKFFGFSNFHIGKAGFFDMQSFRSIYKEYFPHNRIEELSLPLSICATDIVKGRSRYFEAGPLDIALMASSCVPLVFQPVEYEDTIYLDGGILNNFPIEPLREKYRKIIGVHVNSLSRNLSQIHMSDMLDRSFHFALSSAVSGKSEQCKVFIEPPDMSRFGMFDVKNIEEIYKISYDYTINMKERILEAI